MKIILCPRILNECAKMYGKDKLHKSPSNGCSPQKHPEKLLRLKLGMAKRVLPTKRVGNNKEQKNPYCVMQNLWLFKGRKNIFKAYAERWGY